VYIYVLFFNKKLKTKEQTLNLKQSFGSTFNIDHFEQKNLLLTDQELIFSTGFSNYSTSNVMIFEMSQCTQQNEPMV